MSITLALDENDDIFLDAYGNIATVTGNQSIQQHVKTAIRLWLGESDFDETKGVQYRNILGEQLNDELLRDELESAVLGVDGVARVISLEYSTNNLTRTYTVHVKYELDSGAVINESI